MARCTFLGLLLCTACGGGGGAATVSVPVRLVAETLEIGSGQDAADLDVAIDAADAEAPVLLQVDVELPAALGLAAGTPLAALQTLPKLRGEAVAGSYRIVCGDDVNRSAVPLHSGPLLRLRLVPSAPRQPGTYTVRLRGLLASRSDGSAAAVEPAPTAIQVVVR